MTAREQWKNGIRAAHQLALIASRRTTDEWHIYNENRDRGRMIGAPYQGKRPLDNGR